MSYALTVLDRRDATDTTPATVRTVRVDGLAADVAAGLSAVVLGLAPAQPAPAPESTTPTGRAARSS